MNKYIISFLIFFLFINIQLFSQSCEDKLINAKLLYENGKFTNVIETVHDCFSQLKYTGKVEALRLSTHSYIGLDSVDLAKKEIRRFLNLKPGYEPNEYIDAPAFIDLLNEVKIEMASSLTSTVSKRAESIEEAPASMVIINDTEIKNRGYRDLEEIFHDLPGFDISRSRGILYSNIYQRGFRSSVGTERTIILIDGVEDNDLYTNVAYISTQYPLSNIKKIEIIYGPASTMYGSNAFSGVINIITKDQTDLVMKKQHFGVNANISYGSMNTKYIDMNTTARYKEAAISFTARVFKSNDMDLSSYPDWNYGWDKDYFSPQRYQSTLKLPFQDSLYRYLQQNDPNGILHTLSSDGNFILPTDNAVNLARKTDSTFYYQPYDGQQVGFSDPTNNWYVYSKIKLQDFVFGVQLWQTREGSTPNFTKRTYGSTDIGNIWMAKQSFFYVKYNKNISDRISLDVLANYKVHSNEPNANQLKFFDYASSYLNLADLSTNFEPFWSATYFYQKSKQFRFELKGMYNLSESTSFVAGIEYRNGSLQGNYLQTYDVPNPEFNGTTWQETAGGNMYDTKDLGFYAQTSITPIGNMNFSIGLRVDRNIVRDGGIGTVYNPRLSAIYLFKKATIKLIYSEAFKDASSYHKFSTTEYRTENNPYLAPEKVRNFDLVFSLKPTKSFYFDGDFYYAMYSNMIDTREVIANGIKTAMFDAIGGSRVYGFQSNIKYSIANYNFWGNYTYTNAYNTKISKPIGDIAKHQFNIGVEKSYFKQFLILNLRMNFVGDKQTGANTTVTKNPLNKINAYSIINFSATLNGWKALSDFSIQITVNNLLNKEYFSPGVRAADGYTFASEIPQYKRNFLVVLQYKL